MRKSTFQTAKAVIFGCTLALAGCSSESPTKVSETAGASEATPSRNYPDLVSLFEEFRALQQPKRTSGVPDYSAQTLAEQQGGLGRLQGRLAALDSRDWPLPQQVDYQLVRAEMNGLDFYHRVLQPWSTDPDFYAPSNQGLRDTRRGGPRLPLSSEERAALRSNLAAVGPLLEQARKNLDLTRARADMAKLALRSLEWDDAYYQDLAGKISAHHPDLLPAVEEARKALAGYAEWIRSNQGRMTALSGVGKENYNWWLRNVWLMPYTWEECWAIAQREYERTITALRVEEHKNRKLTPLLPVKTEAEFNRLWSEVEDHVLRFVRKEQLFTAPDYLVAIGPRPYPTWEAHPGRKEQPYPFFLQVADRDPMMEVVHNTLGHNFDGLRGERDSRPIRSARRLYGLSKARGEAVGFAFEELMMHAGILDHNPRGREIIYLAAAYRAVRAMADLKLHSNELTFDEAGRFEAEKTPRGWSTADNFTTWSHRRGTPRTPGNEMGYLIGKVQFEKTLADRAISWETASI
jgi:hypothetical protein